MLFIIIFLLILPTLNYTNMLKDMALMMGAQIGASIANQDIAQEFQDTTASVQKDQSTLNNATNNFIERIQNAQNIQINNINIIFQNAGKHISKMSNFQQQQAVQMQSYIESIVSLQAPAINYLDNPILYDQLFTNGTMYTPKGQIWKNVFQVGDWEFDETDQSFWQYQTIPFLDKSNNSIANAFKNFIFTEWNTYQSYEIVCDITLYKVSYPFYVGIIFNKARWVSGDTYGLQKYRTLGIYGDANKKISLCFAQQKFQATQTKKNITKNPTPMTPLEQIYQNQGKQNFVIKQNPFNSLETKPITFHLKIKPAAHAIEYKIWANTNTEPLQYTSITIQSPVVTSNNIVTVSNGSQNSINYLAANYNNDYLYHDIGFICPGAIAKFKLTNPSQLLFSAKNIANFSQEISNYFKDQQYTFASKQLLSTAQGA